MTGIVVVDVCIALAAVAGGVTVLVKLLRALKRFGDALDDWSGEPAREGVPGRPGVMTRLATIEAELHPNHGSSLRDVINRVEASVRRVEDGLHEHLQQHREGT